MAQRKGRAPVPNGASGVGQKALTPVVSVTADNVHVEVSNEHTAGIGFWGNVDAALHKVDGSLRRLFISVRVAKL